MTFTVCTTTWTYNIHSCHYYIMARPKTLVPPPPPEDNTATTLESIYESIVRRVSTLEAELESTKECLEDQKVQHAEHSNPKFSHLRSKTHFLKGNSKELSQNHSIRRNRGRVSHQPTVTFRILRMIQSNVRNSIPGIFFIVNQILCKPES